VVGRRVGVAALWVLVAVLLVLYGTHGALGGSGSKNPFNEFLSVALLWVLTGACLVGALRAERSRAPWLLITLGLASWATGDTIWSLRFAGASQAPVTSVSDIFWLAWYPLVLLALVLLVRDRVPKFELHRWVDGVVVMLIVATPWVALFLQPVADRSSTSALGEVVDFAYPLGDAIIVGAALGAFALMAWRPGRMWLALTLGLSVIGVADAAYSVQVLEHTYRGGVFDAAWVGGAALVAYAAWCPRPGRLPHHEPTGWSAIALPLAAQALAVSIQTYALFSELPTSERALTIVVLLIAMVQLVVTRPRVARVSGAPDETDRPPRLSPRGRSARPAPDARAGTTTRR
jgi:hypothetical protein